uniref:MYND-type domain-containing protein n=1 Tax=Anopheles coluzzii TaxID=1518534 RepID=A0A6E8W4A8_ANOCL
MEQYDIDFLESMEAYFGVECVSWEKEKQQMMTFFQRLWTVVFEPSMQKANMMNRNANETVQFLFSKVRESLHNCTFRERLNLRNDGNKDNNAAQLRSAGNKMVHPKVKRYIEAMKLYNECIAFSAKGSEERSLAYGNRSFICLKMERFEDCLQNIRLARESNYPKHLSGKLDEREKEAKQALSKARNQNASKVSTEVVETLQLSYPAHENAPQLANCLALGRNDQYGRHVVTKRKLKVGDVVMIEKPFVTVAKETFQYIRCDFCQAERLFTLIPCEGCTVAMYCSEECISKAYGKYHRYECGVLRDLWTVLGISGVIALRMIAIAITTFDNDLEKLKDHLDALDESKVDGFTMDWKKATLQDVFNTVHVLCTNQERRNIKELAGLTFFTVVMHNHLLEWTELGPACEANPTASKLLLDLILRYLQITECNYKLLTCIKITNRNPEDETFATSCYPLISMLNHSCAPNVRRLILPDGRCAVIVIHTVAKGGQLFDNYEVDHWTKDRKKRQIILPSFYQFQCTCDACIYDYPSSKCVEESNDGTKAAIFLDFLQICGAAQSFDKKKLLNMMLKLRSFLNLTPQPYAEPIVCIKRIEFECTVVTLYGQISESVKYWKYCEP